MPRHASKVAPIKAMNRRLKPALRTIQSAHTTHDKTLGRCGKDVEDIAHSTESFGRAMVASLGLCASEVNTLAKSGAIASEAMRMLDRMVMQGYVVSFTHATEFVRDALQCGSLDDFNALQADYTHRVANDYFNEANKLCDLLFDSYSNALKPLNECMTLATAHARKAIPA